MESDLYRMVPSRIRATWGARRMLSNALVNGLKRFEAVIDRRFPLQEIGAAFKDYESQGHFGKVCLEL
jgi:NADPH:quinone reductase-like Zn-dependent oxidoreductase